jgi:CMP-N,N'-diacetyllegionaminic acid synthase
MVFVGLVPARGGSKSIPRKNLASCAGQPLIAWTAQAARSSGVLSRVLLSTDDPEIAEQGRALGLEVPFLRPADLADDAAPMLPVMQHALAYLRAEGQEPEALVLLQPTSPLRSARHVSEAVARFRETRAATLVSVVRVPHRFVPSSLMREEAGRLLPLEGGGTGPLRRQDKDRLFARNGPAVLIVSAGTLDDGRLYGEPTVGYEMDERSSLDVDEPADLALADLLLRETAS